MALSKATERYLAFVFGVVFVVVMIVLAVVFPSPTQFQYTVFRVILALAAAGVAAMIPGFLEVAVSTWVKAGGALAVFVIVFFYNPAALVAKDGPEPPIDFEVHLQKRSLDLLNWQFVPDAKLSEKISPVLWKDTFKVKRLRTSVHAFTIRHATTGVPDPEFSSSTHSLTSHETTERPQGGSRPALRIFDVTVDVSGEPVGEWFEIIIEAKYWNACNKPDKSWAAVPVVHPTSQVVFEITFPRQKPAKTWERREGSRDTNTTELVTNNSIIILSDPQVLRWKIEAPRRNWVYQINWEW